MYRSSFFSYQVQHLWQSTETAGVALLTLCRSAADADIDSEEKNNGSWETKKGQWFFLTHMWRSLWGTVTPVPQSLSPQSKREGHCNLSLYETRAIFSQSYLKKTVKIHASRSELKIIILKYLNGCRSILNTQKQWWFEKIPKTKAKNTG